MPLLETRGSGSAFAYGLNSRNSGSLITSGLTTYYDFTNPATYGGQNLFRVSNNPTNASYWALGNASIATTSATTGPTEIIYPIYTGSVYKFTETAVNDQHLLFQSLPSTTTLGNVETLSGYFKAAERSQIAITMHGEGYPIFNLDTGVVTSGGGSNTSAFMRSAGNGWWYCSATFTRTNTTRNYYFILWNNANNYQGVVGSGVYYYNSQLRYNSQSVEGFVSNPSTSELTINGSTVYDMSSVGRNVSLVNSPTIGVNNGIKSLALNGTNQRGDFSSTPTIGGQNHTAIMWLYRNFNTPGTFDVALGGGAQALNSGYYFGMRNDNYSNFMLAQYGNDQDGPTPTTNIAWNSYAVRYSTTGIRKRYFNNQLLSPADDANSGITTANTFALGAFKDGASTYIGYFPGKIAGVQIYNRVLSEQELTENYLFHKSRYGL